MFVGLGAIRYNTSTMSDFSIDTDTGLAYFPALQEYGIRHAITYDNGIWGNMNDGFVESSVEKSRIAENDAKLAKHLRVERVLASKTPIDATITHIDATTTAYLLRDESFVDQAFRLALIHANAIILTEPNVSIVFAPRDCAIVSLVHPRWHGTLLIHIGAHMLTQNLHLHAVGVLRNVMDLELSELTGFITPHICAIHYSIDEAAYRRFSMYHLGIEKFVRPFDTDGTTRYWFDFVGYMKDSLLRVFGINTWVESGICTYESAQTGALFSKRLTDSNPEQYQKSGFNVAFALK